MAKRLPPLQSLRAFEAAGRHESVRRAAEELFVTPSAISHQIRGLELDLGIRLFQRTNRGLRLTAAGEAMLPDVHEAFRRLHAAVNRITPASRAPANDIAGPEAVNL
ncbi:MAG: hypothetical protein OHK0024_12620 [Thalassobaculales bacterium]